MTSGKVARRLRKENPPEAKVPFEPKEGEGLMQAGGKLIHVNRAQARKADKRYRHNEAIEAIKPTNRSKRLMDAFGRTAASLRAKRKEAGERERIQNIKNKQYESLING